MSIFQSVIILIELRVILLRKMIFLKDYLLSRKEVALLSSGSSSCYYPLIILKYLAILYFQEMTNMLVCYVKLKET